MMNGVGLAVVIVTTLDEVDDTGPLLPALSTTLFVNNVRVTVPACVHRVVTSTAVPDVVDVVILQGVAVPVAEKSDEAMPLTVSLNVTVNAGFKVPTVVPGEVMTAEGGVVSRVTVDDGESAAIELPA